MAHDEELVGRLLKRAREDIEGELRRVFAERRATGYCPLYDLLADYPFREGKGLRPAIVFAACGAACGRREQALVSATALELFHNAFLVHDDIEDGSHFRRGKVTLFEQHGVPVAINVGDSTNVLALGLLLENVRSLGVRKALQILQEVERMARESGEGQAIELAWIREDRFDLEVRDYVRMAYKKTCWYTVIAPLRIGAICGSPPGAAAVLGSKLEALIELGFHAGIAFQIHDDLLNLEADQALYGKETCGDLWEGKRTVVLLHFVRTTRGKARRRVLRLLRTRRSEKPQQEVSWLLDAMIEAGSLDYARALAADHCQRALDLDRDTPPFVEENEDRSFLREMLRFVIDRVK